MIMYMCAPTCDMTGHHIAAALDEQLVDAGILRHPKKDEHGENTTTVIGIGLDAGRYLTPDKRKLQLVLSGKLSLLQRRTGLTGDELAAILGTGSWFAGLCRPAFSCFHTVYDFSRDRTDERATLPDSVRAELLLFMSVCPLLEADTRRVWQDCVVATDASTVFGFGVSVAHCDATVTRDIANDCTVPSTCIRLNREVPHQDEEAERPRLGRACHVRLAEGVSAR